MLVNKTNLAVANLYDKDSFVNVVVLDPEQKEVIGLSQFMLLRSRLPEQALLEDFPDTMIEMGPVEKAIKFTMQSVQKLAKALQKVKTKLPILHNTKIGKAKDGRYFGFVTDAGAIHHLVDLEKDDSPLADLDELMRRAEAGTTTTVALSFMIIERLYKVMKEAEMKYIILKADPEGKNHLMPVYLCEKNSSRCVFKGVLARADLNVNEIAY